MNSDPSVNTIQSTKLKDETKKEFKKKLALYNELHTQQRKIKSEMSELKAILIQYFESVDEFREKKYQIGETTVLCNPRGYHGYESRANRWTTKGFDIAADGTVTFDPDWSED